MLKLQVFVSDDCWSCEEARRVATAIAAQFQDVALELLDVAENGTRADVFATPTYLLNGRVIFLGNPTPRELKQKISNAGATLKP